MITFKPRVVAGALALAGGLLGGAVAQPVAASAAPTCYGEADNWTYNGGIKEIGPYTASTRCNDINLRTNGNYIVACVVFVDHTNLCNRDNSYQNVGPAWAAIATDVRNGTRFKVRLRSYDVSGELNATGGKVAY
ncbi:hypothetical protein [Micromonospora sp. NPDC049679]|uniref:hypothetical protein n=1 Tax=Micromonospora sp. NPDC049679 TaxID=3155920 RepID=UPI0033E14419